MTREELYTFEELGIDEEPYVEEFKKKYGSWPILELQTGAKLPVRLPKGQFVMKGFDLLSKFQVIGTEKGKKHPLNIVVQAIDVGSKDMIVITPPFMLKNFSTVGVVHQEPDLELEKMVKMNPKLSSFHDILKQRQKDAIYSIDLVLF
jgi:hypothetical protein